MSYGSDEDDGEDMEDDNEELEVDFEEEEGESDVEMENGLPSDESEIEDDLADEGESDTQVRARSFKFSGADDEENDESEEIDDDEEGDDIDKALKQLKEDDRNESEFIKSRVSSEVEKGKSVRV